MVSLPDRCGYRLPGAERVASVAGDWGSAMTRAEIIDLIVRKAHEHGLIPWEFLGGAIAESALNPSAWREGVWPDWSAGLFQQTVRFADEGDQTASPENVALIKRLYFDPAYACDVAARKFKAYRAKEATALDAWCRYNWPARDPALNPNRGNYAAGLTEAQRILGGTTAAIKLSEVLARGRSRVGDPYVWDGEQPGGFDCSGFVKWCYGGALTSFTDAILGETQRIEKPAPGDIVLYEYKDSSQPGVRFPHVGLFLSDTKTLDARFGAGVGEHDQLSRSTATRYYRRLPGVIVDTEGTAPTPTPTPQETIDGLRIAVAHLADVVIPKAVAAATQRDEALAEAQRIREQFVGPRP